MVNANMTMHLYLHSGGSVAVPVIGFEEKMHIFPPAVPSSVIFLLPAVGRSVHL